MALRLMQVFIPEADGTPADDILKDHEVLGEWRDAGHYQNRIIHVLVPAEEVEPILDRLENAYSAAEGFRVVLSSVEAVVPRPQSEDEDVATPSDAEEEAKNAVRDPGRVSREELYNQMTEALVLNRVFLAMTILSSIVAAVGLKRDDVAVIIGAMVIAPLLGPNVAMALATTLGDLALLHRALLTNVVGLALAVLVSVTIGFTFSVDPTISAIASRTQLGLGDLALALAAGSAGTFAVTRGLASAVIGVMVAVALMPPLVTFGMLLGSGHFLPALGALLLVAGNLVCINLAGVATFLAQGVRPRTWWEEERARQARRMAILSWLVLLITLGVIVFVTQTSQSLGR